MPLFFLAHERTFAPELDLTDLFAELCEKTGETLVSQTQNHTFVTLSPNLASPIARALELYDELKGQLNWKGMSCGLWLNKLTSASRPNQNSKGPQIFWSNQTSTTLAPSISRSL